MSNNPTFLGKLIDFDFVRYTVTLEVGFVTEDDFARIIEILREDKFKNFELKTKGRKVNPITDKQIKFWYVCVTQILKHYKAIFDKDTIDTLHRTLKMKYLPVKVLNLGSVSIPQIPSLTEVSKEDMRIAIDNLVEDYKKLGLDLTKWRA